MTSDNSAVRLDFDAHAATFSKAMSHLDQAATKELDRVDFDHRLRELVRIRASQINGCAYCIDMHTKDARAIGETEQRIYALPAWRETPKLHRPGTAPRSPSPRRSHAARQRPRTGGGLRRRRRAVHARRGRGAAEPDRDDQRLERDRRQHPRLGPWLLPPVTWWPLSPLEQPVRTPGSFRCRP